MFEIFSLLFFLVFFMVFGIIIFTMIRGIKEWNQNNHSPRLTVDAKVVAKRTNVSRHPTTTAPAPGYIIPLPPPIM